MDAGRLAVGLGITLGGMALIAALRFCIVRIRLAERARCKAACDRLLDDGQGLVLGLQVVVTQLPSHDQRRLSIERLLDDADRIISSARVHPSDR